MISYHLTLFNGSYAPYVANWRTADINDPARIARCAEKYIWSGCIWENGQRGNRYFQRADWCVLDFESPEMPLKRALKTFCDMTHMIGTTKSHGTDKLKLGFPIDCFRVAIMFEKPITDLNTYQYNMSRMAQVYPIDRAAKDGGRLFFPCKTIVSINSDGFTQEVKNPPPRSPSPAIVVGVETAFSTKWLSCVIPHGHRNSTLYRVAKDLLRAGGTYETVLARLSSCETYRETTAPLGEIEKIVRSAKRAVDKPERL